MYLSRYAKESLLHFRDFLHAQWLYDAICTLVESVGLIIMKQDLDYFLDSVDAV
jgi:hypothetical protein